MDIGGLQRKRASTERVPRLLPRDGFRSHVTSSWRDSVTSQAEYFTHRAGTTTPCSQGGEWA